MRLFVVGVTDACTRRTAEQHCNFVMAEIAQAASDLKEDPLERDLKEKPVDLKEIDLRRVPSELRSEVDEAVGSEEPAGNSKFGTSHALPKTLGDAMCLAQCIIIVFVLNFGDGGLWMPG